MSARQAGDIDKGWRYHGQSAGHPAPLYTFTLKKSTGDFLGISRSQGAWIAVKYDSANDKTKMVVNYAMNPLDAILQAESTI